MSICHIHKDPPRGDRITKRYRMANRIGICVILICLPLSHRLNSLQLISVTTGLVLWVLLLELWGASCPDESFFGEKRSCKYTANCKISKRELESAVKGGHVINIQDLSDRGEKGLFELN